MNKHELNELWKKAPEGATHVGATNSSWFYKVMLPLALLT